MNANELISHPHIYPLIPKGTPNESIQFVLDGDLIFTENEVIALRSSVYNGDINNRFWQELNKIFRSWINVTVVTASSGEIVMYVDYCRTYILPRPEYVTSISTSGERRIFHIKEDFDEDINEKASDESGSNKSISRRLLNRLRETLLS